MTTSEVSFRYEGVCYERVVCNLCSGFKSEIICKRDRNGLPVQTCLCLDCGLIYINPRMTASAYRHYYQLEYRAQMARFRGQVVSNLDHPAQFESGTRHGRALAARFKEFWANGLILEVGSSVGGVLAGLKSELNLPVIGIEPSEKEANYARSRGIETIVSPIECVQETIPEPGNIVCTQTLNHLLDPQSFFTWAHRNLKVGGILILEVLDFRQLFAKYGWMPRAIQIDHPYMFVPEVLRSFLSSARFEILSFQKHNQKSSEQIDRHHPTSSLKLHIAVAAKKVSGEPFGKMEISPEQGRDVKNSLAVIRKSFLRYMIRFGFRQWRRTGRW